MTRSSVASLGFFFLAVGCGEGDRPETIPVDCSVLDQYEFLNISDFSGSESGWFQYADPTPGGTPNPAVDGSNVPVSAVDTPGRCGDTRFLKLATSGHNFWGTGFGDWAHNQPSGRANGTGYEGISFWARSPAPAEKSFFLNVDDPRTIILTPDAPDAGLAPPATSADQDLDGDGYVGPGDIARGTTCRLPPPKESGTVPCYGGGIDPPPSGGTRVPEPGECGNSFHTLINTTEQWKLFTIPWKDLVQWPCPNRLEDGIDRTAIAKFEIRLKQGMQYEIWLDNIAFYRRR
jgi:hypothetical protein